MKKFLASASLLTLCLLNVLPETLAQRYLVLDRYGKKRIRIYPGDEIWFRQKDNKTFFHDYVHALTDSSIYLGSVGYELPLSEFETFYFPNTLMRTLESGNYSIAGGFLFAAAVEPLVGNARYDAQESATIGSGALALGLFSRLFRWKKFKINKNSRIRVLSSDYNTFPPSIPE